jgi:hypothetical protein
VDQARSGLIVKVEPIIVARKSTGRIELDEIV